MHGITVRPGWVFHEIRIGGISLQEISSPDKHSAGCFVSSTNPELMIELAVPRELRAVRVWAPTDSTDLANFELLAGADAYTATTCYSGVADASGGPFDRTCNVPGARLLKLRLPGLNRSFHLTEVEPLVMNYNPSPPPPTPPPSQPPSEV
jgi:hypothetical protein